jgi:hypothetical protein
MYTSVVIMAGSMLFTRDAALVVSWLALTVLTCLRIPREEAALVDLFARSDPSYTTYRKACPWRLVPGGWVMSSPPPPAPSPPLQSHVRRNARGLVTNLPSIMQACFKAWPRARTACATPKPGQGGCRSRALLLRARNDGTLHRLSKKNIRPSPAPSTLLEFTARVEYHV